MQKSLKRRNVDSSLFVSLKDAAADGARTAQHGGIDIFVSITYLQHQYECFSDWGKQEMKSFWRFLHKLRQYTWVELQRSGGNARSGFGMTKVSRSRYPTGGYPEDTDGNSDMYELRVDQRRRVHGFRDGNIFHICWLDRNHRICS